MRPFNCLSLDCPILGPHLLEASAGTGKTFSIEHVFVRLLLERAAQAYSCSLEQGLASYLSGLLKELSPPYRSGESPSLQEGVLQSEGFEVEEILAVTFTKSAARDLKQRIRANIEEALRRIQADRVEELLQTDSPVDHALMNGDGFKPPIQWEYLLPHLQSSIAVKRLSDALVAFDRCQIFTIHGFCYRMLQEFAFEANLGLVLADPDKEIKSSQRLVREAVQFVKCGIGPDLLCAEQMMHLMAQFNSFGELAEGLIKKKGDLQCASFEEISKRYAEAWNLWPGDPVQENRLIEDLERLVPCYKKTQGDHFALQAAALIRGNLRLLIKEKGSIFRLLDPSNRRVKAQMPQRLHYPSFWDWAALHLAPLIQEASDPKKIFGCLQAAWAKIEQLILIDEPLRDPDTILQQMQLAIKRESFASKVRQKYRAAIIDEFQDTDPTQWVIFQTLFLDSQKKMDALYLVGDPKQSIYRFRKADVYTYFEARNLLGKEALFCLDTNYRSTASLVGSLNALFARDWLHLPKIGETIPCPPVHSKAAAHCVSFDDGKGALHVLIGNEGSFESCFLPYAVREINLLFETIGSYGAFAILVKDRFQGEAALNALQSHGIPAIARSSVALGKTVAFQAIYELFSSLGSFKNPSKQRLAEAGPFAFLCSLQSRLQLEETGLISFCRQLVQPEFDKDFTRDLKQIVEELLIWESREGFSFQGLLRFLEELKELDPDEGGRRHLDTEEDAVQILTMHASKGLEFEVVFALGLSTGHPRGVKEEEEEIDAEKFRQLYVAMTRAKARLYISMTSSKKNRGSASPMELFCNLLEAQEGPVLPFLERLSQKESITYEQLADVIELTIHSPSSLSTNQTADPLPSAPSIEPGFLQSFTSLAQPKEAHKKEAPQMRCDLYTPHTIPRGPETGVAIHQIFEDIFKSPHAIWKNPSAISALIDLQLATSPLLPWAGAIKEMVDRTLKLPIASSFCLLDLDPLHLQTEMEFLFFHSPNYVLGFIDLVFFHSGKLYFVDWKTNWLGNDDAAYSCVKDAMAEHDYWLQARLYTEALRRHVKQFYNEPFEEIFGGAIYLFVRGGGMCHFNPESV